MTAPIRNGRSRAIFEFVAAHPGCLRADIDVAIGANRNNGLLSYCVSTGKVFKAGPNCLPRYYPTRELAEAFDGKLRADAQRSRVEREQRQHREGNTRKRGRRHAAGATRPNTRPDCHVHIEPTARIADAVRITFAKAPPGRYEVTGHFVGQITQDWLARRSATQP